MNDEHPSRTIHLLTNIWGKAEAVIYVLVGLTLLLAALGGLGQLWTTYLLPWLTGKIPLDVL